MGAASNIYIQRRYLLRGLLAIFPRNSGSPFQYPFFLPKKLMPLSEIRSEHLRKVDDSDIVEDGDASDEFGE